MSPEAKAAADAFYATLREKGRRVDSVTLELAWERAVKAGAVVAELSGALEKAMGEIEWKAP